MPDRYEPQGQDASTPDGLERSVTPQYVRNSDHSFTLQTIMELQKSTGELVSSVNSLKESIDKQDSKISKIEDTVSGVTHKIYAATVALAILVALGGFIVNKSWDLMTSQIMEIKKEDKGKDQP